VQIAALTPNQRRINVREERLNLKAKEFSNAGFNQKAGASKRQKNRAAGDGWSWRPSAGKKRQNRAGRTPNLDKLASESECGLHLPIDYGITPGSAPGHLALFGYRPTDYDIGRGVVAAMGIGFPMQAGDVAARVNFATQDDQGKVTDRRAGRIPTQRCAELCELLSAIRIPGVEIFLKPVMDYRAVVVFRGQDLSDHVADTDPQAVGVWRKGA